MRKGCFGLVSLVLLLLVGCRSHPEIPVNDEQSLVIFIGCGHQCRKARPFDV